MEKTEANWRFGRGSEPPVAAEHVHDYDEYILVVQGCYTLVIEGKRIPINAGEEYLIPPEG